jgi:alanine racemase
MAEAAHDGQAILDVDLSDFAAKVAALRRRIGRDVRLFASVKADGYGFGAVAAAMRAEHAGADGVSLVDRAHASLIREAGFRGNILVYAGAPIDAEAARLAERFDLILTVLSIDDARALAGAASHRLRVAVKVEIGTERIGVLPGELPAIVDAIEASGRLELVVVNAHPSLADDAPMQVLEAQYARFKAAVATVVGDRPGVATVFASSKVLRRTEAMSLNAVDPGQMLYEAPTESPAIRRLSTRLLSARDVTRDFAPEWAPFAIDGVRRIGVVPYGKVDGAGKCDAGVCRIAGRIARFLGPPSLEYWRVDLTNIPDAQSGDEADIIGAPDDPDIGIARVLALCGLRRETDFALTVPHRVRRRYIE